jgi:FtsP/CotA-like multicopper oxidase with cupredoxin domain
VKSAVWSALVFAFVAAFIPPAPYYARAAVLSEVRANDNRVAAGTLSRGTLRLSLEARTGYWSPDGPGKAAVPIEAFGEPGKPLQVPGPLVRVPAGTVVVARVRNSLAGTLVIHGMTDRPAFRDRKVSIPFGQERTARFRLDAPGTYYYWGSTTGLTVATRLGADSQLLGAIVVDDPRKPWNPKTDRTFVFSEWDDVLDAKKNVDFNYVALTINGLRYPATERLSYLRGTRVTWHIINASPEDHPLHLHGFYFDVASHGDGLRDLEYPAGNNRERGVTELFPAGSTATLTFDANRAGNWMFHCHIAYHIMRYLPLGPNAALHEPTEDELDRHTAMGGMILRFKVIPKANDAALDPPPVTRRITLVAEQIPSPAPKTPALRYEIRDGSSTLDGTGNVGPPMILTQGQTTAITVENHLDEPTAVHWHGIEQQDAYYDGVPEYSGYGKKIEPMIAPGKSFTARFAAPRAGTFIYHTHMNDIWQLRNGLSGPLIVMRPGSRFDPATDHIVQITSVPDLDEFDWFDVNGTREPPAITIVAGVPNRFRLINMTTFHPDVVVSLASANATATWTPVARDGADIPAPCRTARTAVQTLTIGQTRDYLFTAARPGEYRLLFWGFAGDKLRATLPIHVVGSAIARP